MFEVKSLLLLQLVLILLVAAVGPALSRETDYCYGFNDQPYLKFATKTAYHFVHGGKTRYQTIPNCEPIQIWMLMKHGTKYPGRDKIPQMRALSKLMDQIIYNHETRGHGHLCDNDLDNLKQWRLDAGLRLDTADQLTEQGVEDLNLLARRTKSNFPELFPPVVGDVSSRNYVFRSADGDRSTRSLNSFVSGLFDRSDLISPVQDSSNDTLFTAYERCPKWENEVANSSEVFKEVTSFGSGPEYQNLILNVSRRLGFLYNISTPSVNIMYDMCRYDKAWKVSAVSPWCAVFSEEELRVLEYKEDLTEYYRRGYGHELNSRLGCPLLQDMFRHFQKLEGSEHSNEPKGVFSVARTGDLELFLTAMGFAKDSTPLLASNYRSMIKRQWKTSEIASFAGNLAAVFYKCQNSRSPNKVVFYLAEKPVLYEGCSVGLCDWEYLKQKLEKVSADCSLDFCYPNGATSTLAIQIWLLLPLALTLFSQ